MHIFVGSTNPVKINAVRQASIETWPEVIVEGFEVESGVSHQPFSDEETRTGAENRAKNALKVGAEKYNKADPRSRLSAESRMTDYIAIGLEGGVFEHASGELWNTVWAVVVDSQGNVARANGERFKLPDSLVKLIRSGKEMGPAMDELIGTTNIKHQGGMIGAITFNFIDRTEMYAGLAKLALGLWYGRDWEGKLIR